MQIKLDVVEAHATAANLSGSYVRISWAVHLAMNEEGLVIECFYRIGLHPSATNNFVANKEFHGQNVQPPTFPQSFLCEVLKT